MTNHLEPTWYTRNADMSAPARLLYDQGRPVANHAPDLKRQVVLAC